MASKSLNVEAMLRAAFLKSEMSFLKEQPSFQDALSRVETADDFEALCKLAEELLGVHGRAIPAAQQLRGSSTRPSKVPHSD
jgi:hypothetical protein